LAGATPPLRELEGKTAVVTGGASGIGRALGALLAGQGMKVVLADVERPALDATVAELRARGLPVTGVVTDVSRYESVEALARETFATWGNVHLLFNNAGVGLGEAQRRIWTLPDEDWRWGFGVNVWGVVHGIRAFVPRMIERGEEGHVVNTSSPNGGLVILPTTPIYSATKAAVTSISETLHYQLLMEGAKIKASVLFPGPHLVDTNILNASRNRPDELRSSSSTPATYVDMRQLAQSSGVAFKLTQPEEVAELALDGILNDRFWILPASEENDARLRERLAGILERRNPVLPG
jgi:NAD(P)-dependent dehydrogenase (short-subunit alcohol dehydrogenase family)